MSISHLFPGSIAAGEGGEVLFHLESREAPRSE